MADIQKNEQAACDTNGKAHDIDRRKGFIPPEIAVGDE
jgi:hypothetical protein